MSTSLIRHPASMPTLLAIVLSAVAFESSMAPTINNNIIPNLDKVAHFFTFGLIAWLLATILASYISHQTSHDHGASHVSHLIRRIEFTQENMPWDTSYVSYLTVAVTSFTLVTLLGSANEWIQSFTPGRFATVSDVLADMVGAALFLLRWNVLRNRSTPESEGYIDHGEKEYADVNQ